MPEALHPIGRLRGAKVVIARNADGVAGTPPDFRHGPDATIRLMLRRIGAVVAGLVTALVILGLAEEIGSKVYPLPPGVDPHGDPKIFAAAIKTLPLGGFLFVLAGLSAGTLAGAWI